MKHVISVLVILFTTTITAQSYFKVSNGTTVKVLTGTDLKTSHDLKVENGGAFKVYGDVTTSGTATCSDETAIIVYSTSPVLDGSFIFNNGTPKATVQRYVGADNWHQVAVNVSGGATCNDYHFDFNPRTWLTHFNETDSTWEYITDTMQALYLGEGFDFYIENTPETVDLAGTLTADDLTLTSSTTPAITHGGQGDGYNLVGNPYSSAVEVDDDGINDWTFTNLEKTIWVLDQTGGPANYLYRAAGSGAGNLVNGIVPMGQGFFIHATASNPSLTIPAARRIHNNTGFYKSTNTGTGQEDIEYFTLDVTDQIGRDEIWITFGKNGTDAFENGYDATKLFGSEKAPQLFMKQESIEKDLSINHLQADYGKEKIVKIGFICGNDGSQVINANMLNLTNKRVFLEDLFTGTVQDLTKNSVYKFQSTKNDNPDRFLLHFYNTTGIDDNNIAAKTIRVYSWDKYVYIRNNGNVVPGKTLVAIYDISGKLLINKSYPNASLIRIPLNVSNTYVVVKAVTQNTVSTTKAFIQ